MGVRHLLVVPPLRDRRGYCSEAGDCVLTGRLGRGSIVKNRSADTGNRSGLGRLGHAYPKIGGASGFLRTGPSCVLQ